MYKLIISKDYKLLKKFHKTNENCQKCKYWNKDCYLGKECYSFKKYKENSELGFSGIKG